MPSTYSTNLAIELIGTGDQAGSWGASTNTNLGTLIEQAISGYVTQAITDGADTVITIPNGATGVARNMFIECTGALTAARNLVVPANRKLYFIFNNTSGGFAVTVKVSGQTGISVPNGKKMVLVSNGTDVVVATNHMIGTLVGNVTGDVTGNVTGNAGTVTNGVYNTGDQTIAGIKTFSSTITGNISGNAATSTLATKASTLAQNGANGAAMTFNWSGLGGQPTWLWGGNDGATMNVYNPSNFSVSYAATAGSAGAPPSLGAVGTVMMVLNATTSNLLPGNNVAGSSLLYPTSFTYANASKPSDFYSEGTTTYPITSHQMASLAIRETSGNTGFAMGGCTALSGTWRILTGSSARIYYFDGAYAYSASRAAYVMAVRIA